MLKHHFDTDRPGNAPDASVNLRCDMCMERPFQMNC